MFAILGRSLLIGSLTVALAACSSWSERDIGAVVGGVAGGAAGSQIGSGSGKTIATVVGTIAGAAAGAKIGERMGRQDRQAMSRTFEATPTGETNRWSNETRGTSYAVTPTDTYYRGEQDRTCREFTMQVKGQDGSDQVEGTACRQASGDWKIVSQSQA